MRAGFACCILAFLAATPTTVGTPVKVVVDHPPLPDYCVQSAYPFLVERGSDGSCGSQVMRYVVDEMNRFWCQHVQACPGGRGPFDYRRPGFLP